jgi:hypothetical protein
VLDEQARVASHPVPQHEDHDHRVVEHTGDWMKSGTRSNGIARCPASANSISFRASRYAVVASQSAD